MQISEKYAAKIKELSARLDEMLKAQAAYSREYHIDEDWKAVVVEYHEGIYIGYRYYDKKEMRFSFRLVTVYPTPSSSTLICRSIRPN